MSGILDVVLEGLLTCGSGALLAGPLLARTHRNGTASGGMDHHDRGFASAETLAVTSTFQGRLIQGGIARNRAYQDSRRLIIRRPWVRVPPAPPSATRAETI
ncbi:hypothetical protein GCM10023335_12780 [Streptomyces siamensis]|uniref:Uncharacterized protein n=1 Tax=Streptomyces siamensis TaxID=1274986 RepID=A0ABP9IJJ8_9ACTN